MRPIVGITACFKRHAEDNPSDCVARKYTEAISGAAGCTPVLVPTLGEALDERALLDRVDGLLFTGSATGVEPARYGGPEPREEGGTDPRRDATALPLLRAAVEAGVPVLAICRGLQELNVALGGTLHQHVHELPGKLDHREDSSLPEPERYGPVHAVHLTPGGLLARLFGSERIQVSSLHWQGIDRPAPGLVVEGRAEDGLVEAVRVEGARRFAVGVQWHPEWRATRDPHSRALFHAFAASCRDLARERDSERVPAGGAAAPRRAS